MTRTGLLKTGAAAAIFGGGLRIFTPMLAGVDGAIWTEVLYFIIDILLLFALIAMYLERFEAFGFLGGMCFAIAIVALASLVGPDPIRWGVNFYHLGALVLSASLAALAAVMLYGQVHTRAAIFWLVSFAAGLWAFMAVSQIGFTVAGILFGLGFAAAGVDMLLRLEEAGEPAGPPA